MHRVPAPPQPAAQRRVGEGRCDREGCAPASHPSRTRLACAPLPPRLHCPTHPLPHAPLQFGLSAITTQEVLLHPLALRFRIDVFGHAWSADGYADLITKIWKPVRSRFEVDRSREFGLSPVFCINRSRPIKSFPNRCGRTVSQLLGMQRAIQLKAEHEAVHSFRYTGVFVSTSSGACTCFAG